MGGSGSRLSKELLAEYQVRGTPVPGEFARGPALRSGVPGRAAEGPRPPGGLAEPLPLCFPGLDVPDQAGDPPVSAVSNLCPRILYRRPRGALSTDGLTEGHPPPGGEGWGPRPSRTRCP